MPADTQQLTPQLTKDETVALWHAIEWMALCLQGSDGENKEALDVERKRLKTAKQALRKVNAIRKAQRLMKEQK